MMIFVCVYYLCVLHLNFHASILITHQHVRMHRAHGILDAITLSPSNYFRTIQETGYNGECEGILFDKAGAKHRI